MQRVPWPRGWHAFRTRFGGPPFGGWATTGAPPAVLGGRLPLPDQHLGRYRAPVAREGQGAEMLMDSSVGAAYASLVRWPR